MIIKDFMELFQNGTPDEIITTCLLFGVLIMGFVGCFLSATKEERKGFWTILSIFLGGILLVGCVGGGLV